MLRSVELRPPGIPFLSCLTGELITPAQALDPGYWVDQARRTVRFGPGIEHLDRAPGRILLEVGPGRGLTGLAGLQVSRRGESVAIPSLPRDGGLDVLMEAVSRLWLAGATVDWRGLHRRGRHHP